MVKVIGLDVGGANTKATLIKTEDGKIEESKTAMKYFPIWKRGKKKLPKILKRLRAHLSTSTKIDGIGVTMTAELSDIYWTKKEGVNHVLDCVTQVFGDVPVFVLNVEAQLILSKEARKAHLMVAAANWAATGWMISQLIENCIIVDTGSTTSTIIPIINGEIAAIGKTDLEKLMKGELIYTGALRTNVATIVNCIPIRGGMTRTSSEYFAQSGDVHLLLGQIKKKDYTVDTADGRGITKREVMARLARVICADIDLLSEQEIIDMAQFIYEKQIEQVARGIKQVYDRVKVQARRDVPIVVTGLGKYFLARKSAEKIGLKTVIDLEDLLGVEATMVTPSFGVALMTVNKLEGKKVKWKQL